MQHQYSSSIVGSIGYVGMHTYHLGVWSKPNQITPATIAKYTPAATAAGLPISALFALPIDDPRVQAAGSIIPGPASRTLLVPVPLPVRRCAPIHNMGTSIIR